MVTSATGLADAMAAAWNAGDGERVVALAATAPSSEAGSEGVLTLLGLAQQQMGRHAQAAETFARLSRIRPQVSAYWNNLGVASREAGDFATAERALSSARTLAPEDVEVLYNLGLLYWQQRRWSPARQVLLAAVRLSPRFVEARLLAAHACHVCGDSNGEEAMLDGAGSWPAQPAGQALILAAMLSAQGDLAGALRALARARLPDGVAAEPLRLQIIAQRSMLYERNNQLDLARHELQQLPPGALDALPAGSEATRVDGWRAHALLAMREGRPADAAGFYRRVLDEASGHENVASAGFGLAAACDRQGQHRDAWRALQVAHAAQIKSVREVEPEWLDPDSQPLSMVSRSVDAQTHAHWQPLAGPDARHSPIFVIGFPRSGTTLLEQILDAHPDFRSMDERGFLHELVERMEHTGQRYPADLAHLAPADAEQLRDVYWRLVERVLPDRGESRLVDKNPLNMLCLPMMLRLFPEAAVILCLRHPCDVLLSCSMQPFRSPAFMTLCSSLERLARGYADAFEACCRHLAVFRPHLLEWRYESAVSAFDGEVARLGQFLGVADASPMLDFAGHARRKGFIGTPSYAQVIQPVNPAAVGRWEPYREEFEPVLPVLRPWIERFGYGV